MALFANFLMINPIWELVIEIFNLPAKPFKCAKCLAFWTATITGLITLNVVFIIVAVTAPFLAVAIERFFNSLPIKIK